MESDDELADDEGSAQMDLSEYDMSEGEGEGEGEGDDYEQEGESDEDEQEGESDEDEGRLTDPDYVEEDAGGRKAKITMGRCDVHSSKRTKKAINIQQHNRYSGRTEKRDTAEEQSVWSAPSSTSRGRVRLVLGGIRSSSDAADSHDDSDSTLYLLSDSEWRTVVYD
ncbi:hypothetical protein GLOTRDRAFT_138784 [Gloeophyllum trabeum ATCC 11539]|uniref:Uncharacterized protein n=1 Tax=Gloeophyllum trabeum (strain ATCC 11539 / FP-39264 / Madison 617) TaxID=670483 RepID=S7Q518_GLOTA|nr:uncharacterized protein GLOTRDRAFT_138784 [Gloeophyllum trabeum ATCC 11539]EPQ55121.1 hypothetical protein GLOTRDRAFT_138784 [Gloeophyllum trabeum ATCC 11539]